MKSKVLIVFVSGAMCGGAVASEKGLTLDEAVARALATNPAIEGAAHGVTAAEARAHQAGLWPNPELMIEAENFGGDGNLHGFESAETTVLVSQPLPLGGKPGRRRAVADSEHTLASRDFQSVRLDVSARATAAFSAVLAAQQREELAVKLLDVADDFARVVKARVDAGKVSPVELTRAQIEAAQAKVRRTRSARGLAASRARLAATWGSTTADFDRAVGSLPYPQSPPPLGELRSMLAETPDIKRLEDSIERQRSVVRLENSLRFPDLAIGVGPRRFEETGQSAWVAGVGVAIPIFDRNQGARKAAEFDLERERRNADSARVARVTELTVVCERLNAAAEAARTADDEIVPSAMSALAAVEIGYREGKFGFIDVIAAQRAFFEASTLLLDSLEEYAVARANLERLVGLRLGPGWVIAMGTEGTNGDAR